MKLTPWFPANVKPVRRRCVQAGGEVETCFCYVGLRSLRRCISSRRPRENRRVTLWGRPRTRHPPRHRQGCG
jgi:hypothetical protein